jgi:hypothetical protein
MFQSLLCKETLALTRCHKLEEKIFFLLDDHQKVSEAGRAINLRRMELHAEKAETSA